LQNLNNECCDFSTLETNVNKCKCKLLVCQTKYETVVVRMSETNSYLTGNVLL